MTDITDLKIKQKNLSAESNTMHDRSSALS